MNRRKLALNNWGKISHNKFQIFIRQWQQEGAVERAEAPLDTRSMRCTSTWNIGDKVKVNVRILLCLIALRPRHEGVW